MWRRKCLRQVPVQIPTSFILMMRRIDVEETQGRTFQKPAWPIASMDENIIYRRKAMWLALLHHA